MHRTILGHRQRPGPAREIAGFLRGGAAVDDGVAAQAWRVAVAVLLAARHLDHPVDLQRVLEMALVRVIPGPPERLRDMLDPDNGLHLHALRLEMDTGGTSEARLVGAVAALLDGRAAVPRDGFLRALGDALAAARGVRAAG
ncbi:MAG: hypothetical protein RLO51_20835 [Thalassobaculum sp.]|uniref:hypothetical protein n=1 Tax=Thalassobaculum sp. TaxID=2022740 RepID=UPI0032EDB935